MMVQTMQIVEYKYSYLQFIQGGMKMIRRKFLATLTVASVMASMYAVSAFATAPEWNNEGGQATVDGTSTNIGPTFEVQLPESLAFGINPFELDLDADAATPDNKQIVSTDYLMYNLSNIPVKIDTVTNVTAAGKFDVVEEYEHHTGTNVLTPSATDGNISVLLLQKLPTNVAVANDEVTMTYSPAPVTGSVNITADNYAKKECAQVLTSAAIGTISFGLDAYDGTLKVGNVSGFTFDGAVDATTPLSETDTLTVKTVFTLHSMSKADYTDGYNANAVYTGVHSSVLGTKK